MSSQARRFDALIRPHVDALYAFAWRLSGNRDDAEDLVQDVLAKLYPRTDELSAIRDLRPWLQRVLYNQFVDAGRRRHARPDSAGLEFVVEEADSDPAADPVRQVAGTELGEKIECALARLDHDQRALVVLHLVDGHTLEALTGVFDAPLGTLKSRLHRARARLKAELLGMEPLRPPVRVVDEAVQ